MDAGVLADRPFLSVMPSTGSSLLLLLIAGTLLLLLQGRRRMNGLCELPRHLV